MVAIATDLASCGGFQLLRPRGLRGSRGGNGGQRERSCSGREIGEHLEQQLSARNAGEVAGTLPRRKGGRARPHLDESHFVSAVSLLGRFLPRPDYQLLTALLLKRVPLTTLAGLMGVDRGVVRRRVARLLARITAPEFYYITMGHVELSDSDRSVAELCYVQGVSLRECAKRLNISFGMVRGAAVRIRGTVARARARDRAVKGTATLSGSEAA
jgi:hypothetical protein